MSNENEHVGTAMEAVKKLKRTADKIINDSKATFNELNRCDQFYIIGSITLLLSFTVAKMAGPTIRDPTYLIGVATLFSGYYFEVIRIYKSVWETLLGKSIILLIYAAVTNFVYASADVFVNETLKFDTSTLSYTTSLFAILSTPIIVVTATIISFGIMLLFGNLKLAIANTPSFIKNNIPFLSSNEKPKARDELLPILRVFVIIMLIISVSDLAKNALPTYTSLLESRAIEFVHHFEAKRYIGCKLNDEERGIVLSNDLIVVSKKSNSKITFEIQECSPLI